MKAMFIMLAYIFSAAAFIAISLIACMAVTMFPRRFF
jgi:hypothetical protein